MTTTATFIFTDINTSYLIAKLRELGVPDSACKISITLDFDLVEQDSTLVIDLDRCDDVVLGALVAQLTEARTPFTFVLSV